MRKTKRSRKQVRRSKRARRRGRKPKKQRAIEPIRAVFGSPDDDCRCPLCAEAARDGVALTYFQADGSSVKRVPRLPPMMSVRVVARGRLQEVMGSHEREVEVPEGCKVGDLAEYMRLKYMPRTAPFTVLPSIVRDQPPGDDPVLQAGELVGLHAADDLDWTSTTAA